MSSYNLFLFFFLISLHLKEAGGSPLLGLGGFVAGTGGEKSFPILMFEIKIYIACFFFMLSTKRNNILDRFNPTIFELFDPLKRLNLIEDCRWRRSQKLQIESWLESWASEVLICCKIIPSLSGKAFLIIKYYWFCNKEKQISCTYIHAHLNTFYEYKGWHFFVIFHQIFNFKFADYLGMGTETKEETETPSSVCFEEEKNL